MKSTTLVSAVLALTIGATAFAETKGAYVPHGVRATNPAATVTYNGTTVGAPTYNRVVAGAGDVCGGLSGVGTAVNYSTQAFHVDSSGNYDLTSTQSYDGYITVYVDSFSPAAPLTNCLFANDDGAAIGVSELLAIPLQANRTYYLVTSGFAVGDAGTFTNAITGLGPILLGVYFPEVISVDTLSTSTLALLGLLLLGAGFVAVRRFS